jgi:hypothetical protein
MGRTWRLGWIRGRRHVCGRDWRTRRGRLADGVAELADAVAERFGDFGEAFGAEHDERNGGDEQQVYGILDTHRPQA